MKPLAMAFFCLALAGLAEAQTLADGEQGRLDERRASLSEERRRLEAGFATEEAACHDRFAVNSCLEQVNGKRRTALAELRWQEVALNDAERKSRAEAQLRKIQEKLSPESLQDAARQRVEATNAYRSRLARDEKQQAERAATLSSQKAERDADFQKWMTHQKKVQARAAKELAAAEDAKKSADRQKKAQAQRSRNQADPLSRTPAKSLPLPAPSR